MVDERQSALLTKANLRYLHADPEDRDRRQREKIRNRVIAVIKDFETLYDHLPDRDRKQLFESGSGFDLSNPAVPVDERERYEFHNGIVKMFSFCYRGLKDAGFDVNDFEELIQEAIAGAESDRIPFDPEGHPTVGAKVNIEIEVDPNAESAPEDMGFVHKFEIPDELENLLEQQENPNEVIVEATKAYLEAEGYY